MKIILLCALVIFLLSCENKEHIINYHNQGWKMEEGYLLDGKKHGNWINFDSEQDTTLIKVYDFGELLEEYRYSNNVKRRKTEYKNGVEHGDVITYFPNGGIECEGKMENGEMVGKHVCYYENGSNDRTVYYENGSPGKYIQYHPNGKINVTSDSLGNGLHKIFDTTGVLYFIVRFVGFEPVDTLFNKNLKNPSKGQGNR